MAKLLRIEADIKRAEVKAPTPAELTALAKRAPSRPPLVLARDYSEAVRILRTKKNFCWVDVQEWFASQGLDYSYATVRRIGDLTEES